MSRHARILTWFLGVAAIVGIVWYFRPEHFLTSVRTVGWSGVSGWIAATVVARLLVAESPTRLLGELGHAVSRLQLFSIGWLRTFSNQVVPMTGLAVYLQQIKQQSGAPWQDVAAASAQQTFTALVALGLFGVVAVVSNTSLAVAVSIPLLILFAVLACLALAVALGVSAVIRLLPSAIRESIQTATEPFEKLSNNGPLIGLSTGLNCGGILLRGIRLWLLFTVLGVALDWREALLIVALAESTVLMAITPGGLGIREALVIGAATLLGLPTETAVAVSLIDRLFVVVLSGIMAIPTLAYLSRRPVLESDTK